MGRDIKHKEIFIISDIEGSSGCWSYEASAFKTLEWPGACLHMSLDINAVVQSLFEAGVEKVTIKDFHRTGYNLLREIVDDRARLISGYRLGPVPGIGDPGCATGLMMIGMHASSGSGGFLAHTFTSRISSLLVNGNRVSEAELFSSSLYGYGMAPIFFSGCPVACSEAAKSILGIKTFPIKKENREGFNAIEWRKALAVSAVKSLESEARPFILSGPYHVALSLRDGEETAAKIAKRWGLKYNRENIFIEKETFDELYYQLIRICYFTPLIERFLPAGLPLFNMYGKYGLNWARKRLNNENN